MQPVEQLRWQVVHPVDQLGRAVVGGPCLALLLVGQRHRAQGEDLVDLRAVEQVSRALGRDCGVVVEDDRRAQHRVAAAGRADQHRPRALVAALPAEHRRPLGRVGRGQEPARGQRQQRVRGDQRVGERVVAGGVRLVPQRRVGHPQREPVAAERAGQRVGPHLQLAVDPLAAADQPGTVPDVLDVLAGRPPGSARPCPPPTRDANGSTASRSTSTASSQVVCSRPPTVSDGTAR